MVTPSRLVPEIDGDHVTPLLLDKGRSLYLLAGLRVVVYDDGRVERADQRFPSGSVRAQQMPQRLGGGYVFFQSDSQGTRLWRADGWTSNLKPLSYIGPSTDELIVGFDRFYLRARNNKLLALDADSGEIMPLGQLPVAPSYGAMVFADGWRAVVDTDLRGPMITFDAGASWRPLAIEQRIHSAAAVAGDPFLYVDGGYYRIDHRGQIQFVRADDLEGGVEKPVGDEDRGDEAKVEESPLGPRPLRTVIERGVPDTNKSAVALHRGTLVRVSLPDGEVLSLKPDVVDDDTATCSGTRVGRGFGFVCGVEGGATTIYAATSKPLSLTEIASFKAPRFVSASGNGALVVRGRCTDDDTAGKDMRTYCIVGVAGEKREIAVRGEIGAERVIALADGRVVVLVPPRLGRPGRITVIAGDKLTSKELRYPDEPRGAVKIARRGLWLEGFEQRGKKAVAGWVEAGGPVVGVKVALDGKVTVGKVYEEGGQLLVSGPFAVALTDAESGFESTDGGDSWSEFELPRMPESPGDAKTRGCSRVGCALRGWLRIGWGEPAVKKDLQNVSVPDGESVEPVTRPSLSLACSLVAAPPDAQPHESVGGKAPYSTWPSFRDVAPPALGKDDLGVDKSTQLQHLTPAHVYVWGPKGADWTRAGSWQIRFDDRFAPGDHVRSSAISRPPWSDENSAAEAIGTRSRGNYWRWEAMLDPGGQGALANLCASGTRCVPHLLGEGRPIAALRVDATPTAPYRQPLEHGVARIGETWFVLTDVPGAGKLVLWRADLGVIRPAVQIRQLDHRRFQTASRPRLVRRALGGELGLLFLQPADPASGHHVGQWFVLPLDPSSGRLGEPIALARADLDGVVPRRCEDHDDGWLLDTKLQVTPDLSYRGVRGYADNIETRLRLNPGRSCIEAIAAKAGSGFVQQEGSEAAAADGIPLSARERFTGRRWHMSCRPR